MKTWLTLFLAPPLLCAPGVRADEPPPVVPPAAPAAQPTPAAQDTPAAQPAAGGPAADAVQALREELERVRREAEEARKKQEERIKALENKLEELQPKPATPPATPQPSPVTIRPGFKARIYGFLRADLDMDSGKMFSHPHLPFWVLSPDDPRARNFKDGDFTIHPRLTRVGIDTEAPPIKALRDAKLAGKLEIDFFNFAPGNAAATSNSRHFLRIRHAYGELTGKNYRFLFGQTWDLISPLFPSANPDVLMWNAGNLGDRRPQLRGTYEAKIGPGKGTVAVALLSADAVGGSNRDGDVALDGEESKRPLVQARAAYSQPLWVKGVPAELGVWFHDGRYRFDRASAVNGVRDFGSNALGIDLRLPITKRLLLQGEAFTGKGLADIRGGVGQDINAITGETVHSKGFWGELLYTVSPLYTIGAGVTMDDPDNGEVTPFTGANQMAVGRTFNRAYYIVNRFNLGSGFTVGADLMFFKTAYRGLSSGSSNRLNIYLQHSF